ncbi:unnamed protein product [Lymnaea stagnalis]|uniref:Major facilitator superfamily (MFS) profile domain-containing protein n=1 Tax=Lymnaea stagnalis TaxID=6523 RepID=A0AAV2IF55_LYMST
MMAGQTVGSILFTSLADKFGRKSVLIACNALLLGSGIGAAYSPNIYALLVFRFLAGLFQQGVACVDYTMIVEFLTSRRRRVAGVLCGLNWTISVLFLALVAYLMRDYSWRSLQLLSALLACNVFLYPFLLVESPRWLIANKRYKEALAIIKRMSIMNGKDFEKVRRIFKHNVMQKQLNSHQNELIANAPGRKVERYSVLDILRHKRLLISSLIIWFAWATNVITYYGLFLTSSSLAGNRHLNFFLMALVDIPGDGTNFILLKFFGRKPVLMFLMTFAGSSLLSATLLMSLGTNAVTQTLSTVFSLAGKFGIGASFNAIFLYTPELFPTNLRSAGLGLCSSISRLSGMVAPYSKLLGDVVIWGPGTIFSTMCFLSVLMFTQLPETRGRALPNTISEMKEWSRGKRLLIRDNHAGSEDQVNKDVVINNNI